MKLLVALCLVGAALSAPQKRQAPACGVPAIPPIQDGRIVGGIDAAPNSWPWQAIMCSGSSTSSCRLRCGGSIINDRFILSAAHCTVGLSASSITIKVGAHRYGDSVSGSVQQVRVERIFNHPQYQSGTQFSNDLSIVQLAEPLVFGDTVSAVCLPSAENGNTDDGNNAFVTGHGSVRSGGAISQILQQVIVPFVSNQQCGSSYGSNAIDETMVCLGNFAQGGKDSCQGDSGGPVVQASGGVFYQYGVVSWGRGCALPRYPGVYARVSNQCAFYESSVGSAVCVGGN